MKRIKIVFFNVILCFTFFLLIPNLTIGQEDVPTTSKNNKAKLEFGPEFSWPSNDIHTIKTISFNAFFWTQYFKKVQLDLDLGITVTVAGGAIRDWYSYVPPFVYHKTAAWGAGPVFHFQHIVFKKERFTIEAEVSGGIIFYNTYFPYGGDIYNFMLRAGGLIGYRINNNCSLSAGYKWLHVSNGKGLGAFNPTYEGKGVSLTFTKYLLGEK